MNGVAYMLVIASAATHAYWNFLLKRSGGSHAVVGLSKVVEAVLWVPTLFTALVAGSEAVAQSWEWPVVGAFLVLVNYILLTRAYALGDFSLVYPLSRGAILVFLPPLAFLTMGERLNRGGLLAVALILIGIVAAYGTLPRRFAASRTMASSASLACVAAFVASAYTIWDQRAVQVLPPTLYFAAYTALVAAGYALVLLTTTAVGSLRVTLQREWRTIGQVAVFNSVSYLLALFALQSGKATYVIALRQLSVVLGASLGAFYLNEVISRTRAAGIGLILVGCVLLAWVR